MNERARATHRAREREREKRTFPFFPVCFSSGFCSDSRWTASQQQLSPASGSNLELPLLHFRCFPLRPFSLALSLSRFPLKFCFLSLSLLSKYIGTHIHVCVFMLVCVCVYCSNEQRANLTRQLTVVLPHQRILVTILYFTLFFWLRAPRCCKRLYLWGLYPTIVHHLNFLMHDKFIIF